MVNRVTIIVVTLVVLFLLPDVSHALRDQQKALVGLKGVYVVIALIPEAERMSLTKDKVKTEVELRLRKAGVRVLTDKEWEETPGMPVLLVRVAFHLTQVIPYGAYSISVDLQEQVTNVRDFEVTGTLWEKDGVGFVSKARPRDMRKDVGDQVDMFINDYLAANPK